MVSLFEGIGSEYTLEHRGDPRKGEVDLACPRITEKCKSKVAICAGRQLVDRTIVLLNGDRPLGRMPRNGPLIFEISQVRT